MYSERVKGWLRNAALIAAMAMPLAASAQQAVVNFNGYLYAGPNGTYPLVAQLVPGTPVTIMGCINGYYWCDIMTPDGMRGWISGRSLNYLYQGAPTPLVSIGPMIGVPIAAFTLGTYWNNYYRDRPWYGQPRWWGGRRPLPPAPDWRPPHPAAPVWQPRTPPANWRPPVAHQPAARPQVRESHPPVQNRRPPERRDRDARP